MPSSGPSLFLSTPSARRATAASAKTAAEAKISIHALREEGDCWRRASVPPLMISIHALREEGDRPPRRWLQMPRNFYPRPPRGGRPDTPEQLARYKEISIHALREEGDRRNVGLYFVQQLFLSTPSARRATRGVGSRRRTSIFLSTPSARRATELFRGYVPTRNISIHALREEGDRRFSKFFSPAIDFYPRPPRGGRLLCQACSGSRQEISIHALREEGDQWRSRWQAGCSYFYPRPPRGGRRADRARLRPQPDYFYPRPPRGGRPLGGSCS